MSKKLTFALFNCALILLFASFAFGQQNEIKDKKVTIKRIHEPLGFILEDLIEDYGLTIGFEESILDRDTEDYDFTTNLAFDDPPSLSSPVIKDHWLSINIEDGRLEDVLDEIVRQLKNYKWEINDGVINFVPIRGRDEKYEKLLKVKVRNFTIKKGYPIFWIRDQIFALPEVVSFLEENKLFFSKTTGASNYSERKLPDNLDFSDLTFRELLNKIAKTKGGGWMLRQNKSVESTTEKEFIDLKI